MYASKQRTLYRYIGVLPKILKRVLASNPFAASFPLMSDWGGANGFDVDACSTLSTVHVCVHSQTRESAVNSVHIESLSCFHIIV